MTLAVSETEVLDASDPRDVSRWDELVDQAPVSDVYYRAGYALASEAAGQGKAIGLVLAANDVQVLMPLMLRRLSDLPFARGESGFDAATPYGYGGLLPLSRTEPLTRVNLAGLLDALYEWSRDSDIVSYFVRLHPLLNQSSWLGEQWPELESLLRYRSPTVALDLTKWDSGRQRLAGMRRDRRLDLNHAQRCLRVTWSGSDGSLADALALFQEIYEHRMACVYANSSYFFPVAYYLSLGETLRNNITVALAWLDHRLVGASLFLASRQFAHYHLSGSNDEGRELGAGTFLINAGAQWARDRGCKLLHLGGGVSSSHGLFEYKKSFSGQVCHYHTLEVISDVSRYSGLVERRLKSEWQPQIQPGFFPQYRA